MPRQTLTGTNFSDTLDASSLLDPAEIYGLAGNDWITGSAFDDVIDGGPGQDTLEGGGGNDVFLVAGAGGGVDIFSGGAGYDAVRGSTGDDVIGMRRLEVGDSIEEIDGGGGFDVIRGDAGYNTLNFSGAVLTGIARIEGLGGNDWITGSAFDDVIDGGPGQDTLEGGGGNDVFLVAGAGGGVDIFSGGAGYDAVRGSTGDDVIGMRRLEVGDSIEEIDGGGGFDVIRGDAGYNTLNFSGTVLTGIARIEGLGGNDWITGSTFDDVIVGGSGRDVIDGRSGWDTAVFSGARTDYDVTIASGTVTVVDLLTSDGDDGRDVLTNIERLLFANDEELVLAPRNDAPVPTADAATTAEDVPLTIAAADLLANDSDADGDALALTGVGNAAGGTVALDGNGDVLFTPAADFNGPATFDYTVTDARGAQATGGVTVSVTPVNDVPVAGADSAGTLPDTPLTIAAADLLANDSDADGDALALTGVGNAVGGTVALDGNGDVLFTPASGFSGNAMFDYTLSDGTASVTGMVSVAVVLPNDAPVPTADAATTAEDVPLTIAAADLLANDSDADGDALALTGVGNAAGGTVALDGNGDVLFTPAADFNGPATFDYTVTDARGAQATGGVTVSVTPVNDVPVAGADSAGTLPDTPLTIAAADLLANDSDADGDALALTGVGNAVGGTVALDGNGDVLFTPASGFSGNATFDYTLSDGSDNATGSVTIDVVVPFRIMATVASYPHQAVHQWDGVTGEYLGEFVSSGLLRPTSLTTGPDGNIYVGDSGNKFTDPSIKAYAPNGTYLGEYASLAGLSDLQSVHWITAVEFGPDNELYVLDKGSGFGQAEIFRFEPLGSATEGSFTDIYIGPNEYQQPNRRLAAFDLEIGPDDNLYIPDPGQHDILRFQTPSGDPFGYFGEIFITAFAGYEPPLLGQAWTGAANNGWSYDEIAQVRPWGLAWGDDGLLYAAADHLNSDITTMRIARIDADGNYVDEFVSLERGFDDSVQDIDFGPDGNLYVSNSETGEILVFGDADGPRAGELIRSLTAPNESAYFGNTSLAILIDDPLYYDDLVV